MRGLTGGRRRPFFTIGTVSGGHFLSHFYLLTLPPLFPLLVADFSVGNTELGLTVSMMYLALFLFQIPAGELVDKIGAKRVFVLGLLLTATGTMLIGVASDFYSLLAFAFFAGIGQSAFHPADYALLSAVSESGTEGKSFGVHTFAGFAGFAAAPPIVGGLGLLYSWQIALFAVGFAGLIYTIGSQLTMQPVYLMEMNETEGTQQANTAEDGGRFSSLSILRLPHMLALFAFFVVVTAADIGIQSFTAVFVVDGLGFSEAVGNAALTAFPAFTAVAVLAGGVLADRYDSYGIIVLALFGAAITTWIGSSAVAAMSPLAAIVVWAAIGVCFGLALPARDSVVNGFSSAGTTGKSFGIVYTGLPIGGFVAPVFLGAVMDASSLVNAFILAGAFFFVAALIVLGLMTGAVPTPRLDGQPRRSKP